MKSVRMRLIWVAACLISSVMVAALSVPDSDAQATLEVRLLEDPFVCDAVVRTIGSVSGLVPGEGVEFSSPELSGVFSRRTADTSGRVSMRWNCSKAQIWTVTVRGLASGGTATFVITGITAPPPPDAPLGAAFDAKSAMTTTQMEIWKDFSPYSTVGVYIPVNTDWDNRADKIQQNLTASWVRTIFADGWQLIPIYVGRQAPGPCQTARFEGMSNDPGTARTQGFEAAADAAGSMARLGIGAGAPIYYDLEAYRPGCAEAVIAFLDAWTEGVHAAGYVSGVYGSRSSTMWDLSRSVGREGFDPPDAVWVSTGNGRATSLGLEVPPDGLWTNARMHQYRLSITRTYGGVTREVDENIVNAPLASAAPPAPVAVDNDGDGFTEPNPDNCDTIANPDQADLDSDGDGDVCDSDIDGDGVPNSTDFAPLDAAVTTAPAPPPTATPAAVDTDGDGFAEPSPDNCDTIANPDQADLDSDGDGDACDSDIDGDGVPNTTDREPRDPAVGASPTTVAATATPAAPAATATAPEPTEAPIPLPTASPTTPPLPTAVVPNPLPTAALPTPAPTAPVQPDTNVDEATQTVADAAPGESNELAAELVTITVEQESPLLPWTVATLAIFSAFCLAMGVRSFVRGRS